MSLIADVFDIVLQQDDGSMIASTTLQSADVNISVDSVDVRGGKGAALLAILHSARNVEITAAEMTFKWDWISSQLGQIAIEGATTVFAMPKWYTVVDATGTLEITLENAPLASDSGIKMYDEDGKEVTGTVSGSKVTFTTLTAGDKVEVRSYKYTTGVTASEISIDDTSFAKGVVCILETLELREDETPLARIQFIFDETLPSGNIQISTQTQKDASVSNFTFRPIKPKTANKIGRIVRIPIV